MTTFKGILKDFVRTYENGYVLTILSNSEDLSFEQITPLKEAKKGLKISISPWSEKRSLDANAYFHVLVDKIAKVLNRSAEEIKIEMNLDYGTYSQDEQTGQYDGFEALKTVPVNKFCKYAKPIKEYVKNGKIYVQYLIRKHTSDLDNKEMAKLIDGVVEEAKQLGIETLTPLELENLKGYKR